MSRYENRQELANKIDWEGGIFDMLFGYGLSLDDIPEDDEELRNVFGSLDSIRNDFEVKVRAFERLLPEPGDE